MGSALEMGVFILCPSEITVMHEAAFDLIRFVCALNVGYLTTLPYYLLSLCLMHCGCANQQRDADAVIIIVYFLKPWRHTGHFWHVLIGYAICRFC